MQDLVGKIKNILNEEKRVYAVNGRQKGGFGSFNINVGDGWTNQGQVSKLIQDKSDLNAIQSKNADLFLKLYGVASPEEKLQTRSQLLLHLNAKSLYADVAYFTFFILYRTGSMDDALITARKYLKGKGDSVNGFSNMLAMLAKVVSYEYGNMDRRLLDRIKLLMQGETEYKFQLFEKINSAEFKILENELEDINPEINYDRDKILSVWDSKFQSKEIPLIIKEIEEYFLEGDLTETKFATCIGRIRVLLVEITRKIAQNISISKKNNKITDSSDEHKVFDYLRVEKYITDDEWNLIRSLYGMTSDTGAHAPISNREYARLAKNMTYEIILLMLSKS